MMTNLSQLEKKIGYTFKKKDTLLQALTHSSYAYENNQVRGADNEVLEFLGDSVLGLVIADFMYKTYSDLSEGEFSKLKSAAGSTSSLSYFAQRIKLDKHIRLGRGEEKSGGRRKKTILAGAFEALIAAIYIDGGLSKTEKFLLPHLKSLFKKVNVEKFFVDNYKSALQEYFQKENVPAPVYKTVTTKGPDHKKIFIVEVLSQDKSLAKAKGLSKKNAEKKAAQKALKSLMGKKIRSLDSNTFMLKKKK